MRLLPVFWGCRILTSQYAYEISVRQVMPKFEIELVDLREMHCCGDVLKSLNIFAATFASARILTLVNELGCKDLLTPCSRCYFTISEALHSLKENESLREKITNLLKEEGLNYSSDIKVWHVVDFLYDAIGLDIIKQKIKKRLEGLKFATHIGCQTIRPHNIATVDNSETPHKLDELIKVLGADVIEYPEKLDCCGAALMLSHKEAALTLAGTKMKSIQELGVNGLIDSCPACHAMFDTKQEDASTIIGHKLSLPVMYYTQLLGVALGIKMEDLGLHLNQSPVEKIIEKSVAFLG